MCNGRQKEEKAQSNVPRFQKQKTVALGFRKQTTLGARKGTPH